MAKRWFFGIAFDRPLSDAIPPVPFAEASLTRLSDALNRLGFMTQTLLGHEATATVAASRLRRLKLLVKPADTLLLYYSGFAFGESAPALAAWDTLPEDLADTGLPLQSWLKPLARKLRQVGLILDLLPRNDWTRANLHRLAEEMPNLSLLAMQQSGQESLAIPSLKSRLGASALVEAFSGHLPAAVTNRKTMNAKSLCEACADAMTRLCRRHFEPGLSQVPQLIGQPDAEWADLSPVWTSGNDSLLTPDRLQRVVFQSEVFTKVKELRDFRKTYQVPDSASPSARKFIARISQSDIRQDLDDLVNVLREPLHLRRKDVEISVSDDGTGQLRTPHFTYLVSAQLHADDPSRVRWVRELSHFREANFLISPVFHKFFAHRFDQLVLEFRQPVDVEALIDQLEEQPIPGVKLHLSTVGCELTLAGYSGRITLVRQFMVIQGRGGLLDQLLAFWGIFHTLDEPPALPGRARSR